MSGTSLGQTADLSAGDMLGRYELLVPIGTGGMGNVWAARLNGTRGFRKLVAIKTILRPLVSEDLEQMLYQEAVLASQIHHQNVAQTFELAEHEGILHLVMELVPGEPLSFLRKAARQGDGIPLLVAVNLVGQICRGLKAAHDIRDESGNRIGLVHRDISAPNVMVTPDGTAKIVDFGVATTTSATDVASLKGKTSNMAPEQLRGEPVDARADIFATGILLYSLTVGRHPFRAGDDQTTKANILSNEAVAPPSGVIPDYPKALETVVLRALEKDRAQRFQTAAELLDELVLAVPDAFGPSADALVASFAQGVMKDRLEERRSALRVAEELAERSSMVSLVPTAATHSAPTEVSTRRVSRLGLVALFAGFGVLGLAAASIRVAKLEDPLARLSVASSNIPPARHREPSIPEAASAVWVSSSSDHAETAKEVIPEDEPSDGRAETPRVPGRARHTASPTAANGNVAVLPSALGTSDGNGESPTPPQEAIPEASANAGPVGEASDAQPVEKRDGVTPILSAVTTATSATSPTVRSGPPPKRASSSPLLVASRVGHNQLRIDPSADAYRPRIPHALGQSGQSWNARVNICVNRTGTVSKVEIEASASPALDGPIAKAISRWRYEPLRVGAEATPFCYSLAYQFSGP